MRKLWLIAGASIGFVLGSKSGSGFYDALAAKGRDLKGRPEVRDILDQAGNAAHDEAHRLADLAKERVANVGHSDDDESQAEARRDQHPGNQWHHQGFTRDGGCEPALTRRFPTDSFHHASDRCVAPGASGRQTPGSGATEEAESRDHLASSACTISPRGRRSLHSIQSGLARSSTSRGDQGPMSETPFSVSVGTTERCAVVSVVGEVDVATAPGLRDQLNESMTFELPILVVDMLQTTFLDSTGLGILIETMKEAESRGTSLRIVASDPRLLKVFTITGLTETFDIRSTRQEAGVE